MISILNSWDDVGHAVHTLTRERLPGDDSLMKSWDLLAIKNLLPSLGSNTSILDMGAGGSMVLRFLATMGVKNLYGLDLRVSLLDRLRQLKRMLQGRTLTPPWRLYRMDLTRTSFPNASFDLLTCVSVMEHGMAWEPFFRESRRLLRRQGLLYVSVDYWEPKIHTRKLGLMAYGLPWNIFCAAEIREALALAGESQFRLLQEVDIPPTQDAVVYWGGQSYTFLSMTFVAQ